MMKSYVDEKYMIHFFESLIKSERFSDEARLRESILDFFKSNTDLYLDTDFKRILDEFPSSIRQVLTPLLTQLTTGRNGTEIYSNQNKPFYLLKKLQVYYALSKPFASFWVANYRKPIDKYREINPYYFLSEEDDLEVWKSFSKSQTFYIGKNNSEVSHGVLKSWEVVKKFAHPMRDIVISDRYCLKDSERIENNLISLICNLCKSKESLENVIFFVKPKELFSESLSKVHHFIKESLERNGVRAHVKIYSSSKTPHDRVILTNNLLMKSGDSFDYFNKNGSYKTNGTTLTISPVFKANKTEVNEILKVWKDIKDSTSPKNMYGEVSKNMLDLIEF